MARIRIKTGLKIYIYKQSIINIFLYSYNKDLKLKNDPIRLEKKYIYIYILLDKANHSFLPDFTFLLDLYICMYKMKFLLMHTFQEEHTLTLVNYQSLSSSSYITSLYRSFSFFFSYKYQSIPGMHFTAAES